VDEFQDTNIAQIELLWQLAADHRNVVAVGDNAQAIVMTVADDNTTVHVRIDLYAAARCEPRGTPDAQAEGDVPLATAGTWIIYNNFSLATGLTFSQQWSVQNATTATDCGTTVCVNSVAGTAPGDCDAT